MLLIVDTADTVAQPANGKGKITRPTLKVPDDLWRGVKQAALNSGMTAQDYVIDMFRREVRPKKLRRAS